MKKIMLNPAKASHTGLKVFAAFCGGLALGLLISPIKNGIGCNSGNLTNHYHYDDCCGDDCECDGECECGKEEDA